MNEQYQVEKHKKEVSPKEDQDFLKLIRKSDLQIMDKLGKTPSKISISSLLLSSEAHIKALMKFLNVVHVTHDITIDKFDDVVANTTTYRYLGFNEVELLPEGTAHNKALHISVTYMETLLSRVLVDNALTARLCFDCTNSPTGFHLPFTARLCFDCTNNMAEYEACIYEIEATIDLRIRILDVYGDSTLVISQVKGDWETQDSKLIPYKEHIMKLIPNFDEITFHHIPREENQIAYALATLASMFKVKWRNEAPTIHIDHLDEPEYYLAIEA